MIEYLVDGNLIEIQEPPRMNYGKFLALKGYNLFGVGQQAVHNAGSSIMNDTPTFKKKVVEFINQYIEFNTEEFPELIKNGKEYFYEQQRQLQIPLHRITDSASNGSVFPVVTEHFSASSDHAFL